MAIQMRRGQYADFDPSKMTPGEWAVAIDNDTTKQIIWMCFAPGVVKRIGTYEDYIRMIDEYIAENYSEYIPDVICPVELTSIASKAYAVGDLVITNAHMYKVTQAIAQGDNLVPTVNLSETTVEDELKGGAQYGMITENVESSSTSSKAYTVGELLIYYDTLYRVTQAISQGGTLSPDTNISQVTVEALLATKVDKETGKGLSTNDYTTSDKNKLSGIATGAQVNVIETVKVNDTALTPTNKAVNIDLSGYATKTELTNGLATKQDTLTFDDAPTAGSNNPVKSGGVKTALDGKVDTESGKGLSTEDFTTAEKNKLSGIAAGAEVNVIEEVQVNGTALTPTSKAVNIDLSNYATKADVSSVYKYKGTVSTYADLPSSGQSVGDVYNIETADSTHGIDAGANVAWDGSGWDVLAGTVDLSGYATKTELTNGLALKQNVLTFDTTPTENSTNPVTSGGVKTALDSKANTADLAGVAQDDTGQDIIGEILKDAAYTENLFQTVFNSLPSDERVLEIYDELVVGNSYLDLLVTELQKGE